MKPLSKAATRVPADAYAEQVLLGSILYAGTIVDVSDILVETDFYEERHRTIYREALALHKKNNVVDLVSVRLALIVCGSLDAIGGASYLADMTAVAQDVLKPNAREYARIIRKLARQRALITASLEVAKAARDGVDEFALAMVETAHKKFAETYGDDGEKSDSFEVEADQYYEEMALVDAGTPPEVFIPTPFPSLDSLTRGFRRQQLIVIGGAPMLGKTNLAVFIADSIAKRGKSVRMFTAEVSPKDIFERRLVTETGISQQCVDMRAFNPEEHDKILEGLDALKTRKFYVSRKERPSVLDIRSECRRQKEARGLDLVVIDYLQMIKVAEKRGESRAGALEEAAYELKELAKELDIPIIVLSSINRSYSKRDDKTPQLFDLRDSGGIDFAADTVLMLHRDEKDVNTDDLRVFVRKARKGFLGHVDLRFDRHLNRYSE